jgi:hypothetical protein
MANDVRVTLGMDTKQADDALKKYQINVKKAGLALSAIGAGGALAIRKFTSAALEQEKAMAGVLNSARNTGESMVGLEEKIARATAALENKTNFGDEEQLRVLTKMIPVLGSTEKALEALPLIMDAAATTGRGLAEQSETLTKALAGQVHTAESLGIKFDENATFAERLAHGFSLVEGQAEAQADPFTQLNNALGSMQEEIGARLLPILSDFADTLTNLVKRYKDLNPALQDFIAFGTLGVTAFAGITGATILFGVALKGVLATSIAFIATPVGAVIMAIAAAVAAVIVVFKNWDRIVHGVKVSLNVMIDLVNKTVLPGINNLIRAFNAVSPVDMGLIPEMEKLDTTFVRITEAVGDTGNALDDLDVNLVAAKSSVAATNDEFQKFQDHLKAITSDELPPMVEAQLRLNDIIDRVGGKTRDWNDEIQDLVSTGLFTEVEAINEVAKALEGDFAQSQRTASNEVIKLKGNLDDVTDSFHQVMEGMLDVVDSQRLLDEAIAKRFGRGDQLSGSESQLMGALTGSKGMGPLAGFGTGSVGFDAMALLNAGMRAEAEAMLAAEGKKFGSGGRAGTIIVNVNATTNTSNPDDMVAKVTAALGQAGVSSEQTRSS